MALFIFSNVCSLILVFLYTYRIQRVSHAAEIATVSSHIFEYSLQYGLQENLLIVL